MRLLRALTPRSLPRSLRARCAWCARLPATLWNHCALTQRAHSALGALGCPQGVENIVRLLRAWMRAQTPHTPQRARARVGARVRAREAHAGSGSAGSREREKSSAVAAHHHGRPFQIARRPQPCSRPPASPAANPRPSPALEQPAQPRRPTDDDPDQNPAAAYLGKAWHAVARVPEQCLPKSAPAPPFLSAPLTPPLR